MQEVIKTAICRAQAKIKGSQQDLADAIGMKRRQTISDWENGKTDSFELSKLIALFDVAGMSLAEFQGLPDAAMELARLNDKLAAIEQRMDKGLQFPSAQNALDSEDADNAVASISPFVDGGKRSGKGAAKRVPRER